MSTISVTGLQHLTNILLLTANRTVSYLNTTKDIVNSSDVYNDLTSPSGISTSHRVSTTTAAASSFQDDLSTLLGTVLSVVLGLIIVLIIMVIFGFRYLTHKLKYPEEMSWRRRCRLMHRCKSCCSVPHDYGHPIEDQAAPEAPESA